MWRSDTLAMVVSSTSMKVASDTTIAMSHGLCLPAAERGNDAEEAAATRCPYSTDTLGLTDMPGPTGYFCSSSGWSNTILTGTRCVTFT